MLQDLELIGDKLEKTESAARAQRVGSQPNFHFGSLHTAVQWAEEEPEIDPQEHAKIKIAFVRNLPSNAEENYLKQFFELFGKVEKVVVSKKASSAVGFVNFSERSLYKGFTSVSDSLLHDLEHRQNSWGEKLYAYAQQQRELIAASTSSIGKSVLGVPLWAIEISDMPGEMEAEPALKFIGNVHGDEPVGCELLLLLANWLCDNYMKDSLATLIVDHTHLHILPSMNPDGFFLRRCGNANNIDLNRDFLDQVFCRILYFLKYIPSFKLLDGVG